MARASGRGLRQEGRFDETQVVLRDAFDLVECTGIRCHEAELHRLQGELFLGRDEESAEVCFRSMEVLGLNGALIWTSITGGKQDVTFDGAKINLEWVLGNKLLVSSVNGNRHHFELGLQALSHGELTLSLIHI